MAEVRDAIAHFAAHFTRRAEQAQAQRREVDILSRLAQAQRQQMESVLDLMSDAVLVTDPFNDLALANEAARRLLHIEGPGPRRQRLDRVLGDPSLVALIKGASEAVGSGAALRRQVEHRLGATPDDAFTSVFEVTLASLDDRRSTSPSRGGAGLVTVLRDVTRERAIAQMKSDFVNAVSHEMRTPLSSILAYLELLVDGEAGDEATRRRFYAVLQSETERLKRLIDNILNLSRIEAGAVRVQRERIDLRDVARQAVEVIRPQARAKRIEVAQAIAPLPLLVLADRDMMDQALLNLLSNAVKYTPEGGRVMLSADVDDARASAVVCVSDNGVGIPAQDLPRVFEKFYRVADHAAMAKGTGLGLSLVKQIIEAVHGGHIEVQSQPGEGAAFTFTLPLADYPC
jgi:two-component system phosphate regulon sensor histidine kinase PhoR